MAVSFEERRQAIVEATKQFARADANAAVSALEVELPLGQEKPSAALALATVQALLNARWFELAARLGATLRAHGFTASPVTRRYAQALIEQRELAKARILLTEQLQGTPDGEFAELHGLLGRTYKQMFVERLRSEGEASAELLHKAIDAYDAGYRLNESENTWHGINLVACLQLAARHAVVVPTSLDADALVGDVLAYLDAKNALTPWDLGTRAEALLCRALAGKGTVFTAMHALREYAEHPGISAFNLGSTLRQFEEIWELDTRSDDTRELLFLLRARITAVENGSVRMSPTDVRAVQGGKAMKQLELAFGKSKFTALDWFHVAIQRCSCVAKIASETGQHGGTGFLMRGGDLRAEWGDELVLVTNHHVVGIGNPEAIPPSEAKVRFEASDAVPPGTVVGIGDILFSSPKDQLDVTIARLKPAVVGVTGLQLAESLPTSNGGRVLIIGHPDKGDLAFSIMDNQLLGANERLLHYRAPTEGGSSGSPVFNMSWKVIGLHHAGGYALERLDGTSGTYEANEGIRLDVIVQAVRALP